MTKRQLSLFLKAPESMASFPFGFAITPPIKKITRMCDYCGNPIISRSSNTKYCTMLCGSRAAKEKRPSTILRSDWEYVLLNDPCAYCKNKSKHIDHIIPLSNHGSNDVNNLTGACEHCNCSKGAKPLLTFLLDRTSSVSYLDSGL